MRRGPRRPGDSGIRGVGLEVAGGDERDVEDLPPLLRRDRILTFFGLIGASIHASMTRHRKGRIRPVTLCRNGTRVTVKYPTRGRERTNGDSTMTSVAQDRRVDGTRTRSPRSISLLLCRTLAPFGEFPCSGSAAPATAPFGASWQGLPSTCAT